MLRMGFGRGDITPALGLRMAGTPPWPEGAGVYGPLRGRVVLADDGRERIALVCLDLMVMLASEVAMLRQRLAAAGGLDPAAILVACSHTHGAPFTFLGSGAVASDVHDFLDGLAGTMEAAMADAVADLRPVTLVAARIAAQGWAFNRRPIYTGDQVATHGVTWGEGFTAMEDTPDEELQVLVAREPGGAITGGFVSFACHPTVMMGQPVYSSDYAGVLTDALEARHGGTFGFLQGASGDTANVDPADRDPDRRTGWAHTVAMGQALADRVDDALAAAHPAGEDRVRFAATVVPMLQRRPRPERVEFARWYLEEAPADLDEHAVTRRLTGHDYTFYEVPPGANERHARELLGMWEWQRRAGTRELVDDIEIQALRLGDVAVAAFPVELFTAHGWRLKARAPIPDTFVATLANGWFGYAPTEAAFGRGGYETVLAYQSRLAPEAGTLMTTTALDLLDRLANRR